MTDYSKLPDTMMPQVKHQITARITALKSALAIQQKTFADAIKTIEDRITEAEVELKQVNERLK